MALNSLTGIAGKLPDLGGQGSADGISVKA